jgi:hypothetical protein
MQVNKYGKCKLLFTFLQVQSQKPSSAVIKLVPMTATGKEDPESPLLRRISSLVTSLRNGSPNKCFRVQITDTSQHQLCESGLRGQIAAKKPLLKDTN